MSYLLYILAPIVVFLVFAVSVTLRAADSPKSAAPAQPEKAPAAQTPLPPAREIATFSKTKLRQMLAKIETTPAPEKDMVFAMCYSVIGPPERVEYICPTCNKKTLYVFSSESWNTQEASQKFAIQNLVAYRVTEARRLIKQVQKYAPAVRLRENDFCDSCNPKHGTPNFGIVIRYDDGTDVTTDNISSNDLLMLISFFSGELASKDIAGIGTYPLLEHMPRLKQLLGEPATPSSPEKK